MADDVLTAAFRRCKPASLRATLADGSVRELAPPAGKRKRWSQITTLLDRMAWVSLELLDVKGRLVDCVENDQAGDIEDIQDATPGAVGTAAKLLTIMLRGQDVALKRHGSMVESLVNANLRLCDVLMGRVESLEKGASANLKMAEKYARKLAAAGDEDENGLMSSDLVADLMPMLLAKVAGIPMPPPPPPPPKTNPPGDS